MKKSISIWSFPGGLEGHYSLREAFSKARLASFDGIELATSAVGELTLDTRDADIRSLAEAAIEAGVRISSLVATSTWDYLFTSNDKSVRQKAMQVTVRSLEIARSLNVDKVMILPGSVDGARYPDSKPVSYDVAYERVRDALQELGLAAERFRISIAFENVWNKFLLSPLEVRGLIDSVGCAYVGINFDTGNVVHFGYPEQWIHILGHRLKGIHLKDFRSSIGRYPDGVVDLLEGDVNWPSVVDALHAINYDGYVVAEAAPPYAYHWDVRLRQVSLAMDRILGHA
jgi:L-ribulose-5-phosphate 3-epimerase